MRPNTTEHTGLLRMGLEVDASITFWNRCTAQEEPSLCRQRAIDETWYPNLSPARLKYLLGELEKRFPAAARDALKAWRPEPGRQAALVCHWHLQWSDPLYRDFSSQFLVAHWAQPEPTVTVSDVEAWLQARGEHRAWSPATQRRLANGLLSAATEAGLCRGSRKPRRELCTMRADPRSLEYLRFFLAAQDADGIVAEEIYLSGISTES